MEPYTKNDKKLNRAVARFEKDVGKITSKTPTKVSLKTFPDMTISTYDSILDLGIQFQFSCP